MTWRLFEVPVYTCHKEICHSRNISVYCVVVIVCFRYRIEYEALSKVESEQNEFIDQFILQK